MKCPTCEGQGFLDEVCRASYPYELISIPCPDCENGEIEEENIHEY
jgi:DnaJ-class molecular chaperone